MRAYRLLSWQKPPALVDVPMPEPGPGQVVLRVGGCGACQSDLHLIDWPGGTFPWKVPFTLGHEVAGWVHAIGAGVEGFCVGDAAVVYGPWGCGRCVRCRVGEENYCERSAELGGGGAGLGRDGGMAEYVLVPSPRLLVPIGSMDPVRAAPLSDAGLTAYHAVKRSLGLLVPGSSAVVIGVGGLGHLAVQILRALSPARVLAVDKAEQRLRLAREVGAVAVPPGADGVLADLRAATGARGADVVLDFVGSDETLALAAKIARPKGHLTVVGLALGTLPFRFFGVPYECSVATTYWGSIVDLIEVVDLARAGRIHTVEEVYPLARVDDAYAHLRAGTLLGRAVITP